MGHCADRTRGLFNEIRASLWQSNNTFTYYFQEGVHSFRIGWENSDYWISVAIPPDVNSIPNPNHWVYETALWSVANNNITYDDDLNYDDVLRFDTPSEVIAEVNRVFNLTQSTSRG